MELALLHLMLFTFLVVITTKYRDMAGEELCHYSSFGKCIRGYLKPMIYPPKSNMLVFRSVADVEVPDVEIEVDSPLGVSSGSIKTDSHWRRWQHRPNRLKI